MEVQYMILNSLHLTYTTCIKMETKDGIRDSSIRTGDHLTRAIGILGLETKTSSLYQNRTRKGDGAIVVPYNREGLQDFIIDKVKTSGTLLYTRQNPLLRANALSYYSKPVNVFSRNISSKPLHDIEVYKKAYDKIKSNPGNMSPGTDGQTLDGMSIKKLIKIRKRVINWSYKCKPTKRIFIPRANGKFRPLGIPCTMDKLLQVVIKDLI
jgi:hypothetical protein